MMKKMQGLHCNVVELEMQLYLVRSASMLDQGELTIELILAEMRLHKEIFFLSDLPPDFRVS